MELVARGQLLAQQAQSDLGDGHGIEGVHAFPGGGRRMGLPAGEVHIEVGDGQAGAGQAISRPRVDHHGGVHALEGAPFQHEDLASTALFGRRAQHSHLDSDLISHRGQGQPGTDGRGGNDVVPAGMAHVGQGVVFGAHGHHQFTLP